MTAGEEMQGKEEISREEELIRAGVAGFGGTDDGVLLLSEQHDNRKVSISEVNAHAGADVPFSPQSQKSEIEMAEEAASTMKHTEAGQWTIDPSKCTTVQNWDFAICVALIYTAVVTPAEVGFVQDDSKIGFFWLLFGMNMFVNFIFVIDVVLQFFLHYQLPRDKGGTWIRNHRRIVDHYLRGSFAIDFLSTIPYGALAYIHPVFVNAKGLRLLRLMRLTKLLRILRSSRLINRYRADMSISYGIIQLNAFVVITIIFCHWMACIWGFVAHTSSSGGIGNSWMGAYSCRGDVDDCPAWNIENPKNQYILALYFAIMTLTTVGYGDVLATNTTEYAVMIFFMFIGGFLWAYIIGAVCAITATLDIKKIEHQQLYDQINNMLVDMTIARPTAARVRSYLFQTEEMERRDGYASLVQTLSPELQGLMCDEISAKTLSSIRYLEHRANRFRFQVYKNLTRQLYVPQEMIEHEARLVIIANQGVVGSNGRIYTSGMAMNKDFFLYNDDLREAGTVPFRALNYVEFEKLTREAWHDIVQDFPAERVWANGYRTLFAILRKVRLMLKSKRRVSKIFNPKATLTFNPEDFGECYAAVRDKASNLELCGAVHRDNAALIEAALVGDAGALRHASLRLKQDASLISKAIERAGPHGWMTNVLPHVEEPQRSLLSLAATGERCPGEAHAA